MRKTILFGAIVLACFAPKMFKSCLNTAGEAVVPDTLDALDTLDISEAFAAPPTANGKVIGHRQPLPSELLAKPIPLKGECTSFVIKEWRGTQITPQAIKIINNTCNTAAKSFFPFVKEKGYTIKQNVKFVVGISLIPWDQEKDGADYRGLNDMKYRFVQREKFCDAYGRPCHLWETPLSVYAVSDKYRNWIFLLNDVYYAEEWLPSFRTIWTHELFHTFSHHYGVFDQHPGMERNKITKDEEMAYAFADAFAGN
jgi:hypothetical protein